MGPHAAEIASGRTNRETQSHQCLRPGARRVAGAAGVVGLHIADGRRPVGLPPAETDLHAARPRAAVGGPAPGPGKIQASSVAGGEGGPARWCRRNRFGRLPQWIERLQSLISIGERPWPCGDDGRSVNFYRSLRLGEDRRVNRHGQQDEADYLRSPKAGSETVGAAEATGYVAACKHWPGRSFDTIGRKSPECVPSVELPNAC